MSVIIKTSQFIEDDGGFDELEKKFDALGDRLIKRAKEVREKISLVDVDNTDEVKKLEKQTEDIASTFEKLSKARADATKIEEEYQKRIKKGNQTNEDQIENLARLDKELQEQRTNLKELNKLGTIQGKVIEDVNKERVNSQIEIKKINKEIRNQQKEILKSNELTREESKLLRAKIILEKEEVTTLQEVRERISALRTVVQSLNLETQADQVKSYNDEIDELTGTLSENSDKFVQNKINVGNYEESIVNALKGTQLFSTGLGVLDNSLDSVFTLLTLSKEQLDELEKATENNRSAIQKFALSFGRLNKALKASIIGIVVVGIAALSNAFGDTRAGAIRTQKVLQTLQVILINLGKTASSIVGFIGKSIKFLTNSLNPFTKNTINLGEEWEKTWKTITETTKAGADAVVKGLENIERAFQIEDRINRLNIQIARLTGEFQKFESISDDSTLSLREQLEASETAIARNTTLQQKNVEVAKLELELINERLKQNIKANGTEVNNINLSLRGQKFAEAALSLAEKRGSQLGLSNSLLQEQQEALLGVIDAENELNQTSTDNERKRREIQRDLFEQNLDLLIDLIDTEKNLSEQAVNDVNNAFRDRIDEFNNFLVRFRSNATDELEEFNKIANSRGVDIDLSVSFDEEGNFELLNNGIELSIDNIKELNEELQETGLNEIEINRLREFVKETGAAVKDFKDLNREINQVGIQISELTSNLTVDETEIDRLESIGERIRELAAIDLNVASARDRKKILDELKSLEDEKTKIISNADAERRFNRIDAIDAELRETRTQVIDGVAQEVKVVEDGSQRQLELLRERAALSKEIVEESSNAQIESIEEANKKAEETQKEILEGIRSAINAVLDQLVTNQQEQVRQSEQALDRQQTAVDNQRARAEQGLQNTLAFEQRELGKREGERIKQQQRQERLERIKSVYAGYSNYASQGRDDALGRALRDFAILEAITASFGDGGITGIDGIEGVRTNSKGVSQGRSHNGNGKGILAYHERGEGWVSKKAIDNMGEDTFYTFHQMAKKGLIDSNFFSKQKDSQIGIMTVPSNDNKLLANELRSIKKTIENQPVPEFDFVGMADGTMKIIQTVRKGKSIKRNVFITKKPRL